MKTSLLEDVVVATPARDCQPLIQLFNTVFAVDYQTILVRGDGEPLYLPAHAGQAFHQVIFAHNYFASALHEIAHWCIAGKTRRLKADYGYWYQPDGRNLTQQVTFERVEIKPQALEWIFSVAANHRFHFSADNLAGQTTTSYPFKMAVWLKAQHYLKRGLPTRAQRFQNTLSQYYQTPIKPLAIALPKPTSLEQPR